MNTPATHVSGKKDAKGADKNRTPDSSGSTHRDEIYRNYEQLQQKVAPTLANINQGQSSSFISNSRNNVGPQVELLRGMLGKVNDQLIAQGEKPICNLKDLESKNPQVFDSKLDKALRNFQSRFGREKGVLANNSFQLEVDGVAGTWTFAALRSILEPQTFKLTPELTASLNSVSGGYWIDPALEEQRRKKRNEVDGSYDSGGLLPGYGEPSHYDNGTGRLQNVPYFNQADFGAEIRRSGCGPTSLAMAISAKTGRSVDPRVVGEMARERGLWGHGGGSSYSLYGVIAAKYGLQAEQLPGYSVEAVQRELRAGNPVILGISNFTTGNGHLIVAVGYNKEGFFINDPGHRNKKFTSWQEFRAHWPKGNAWAVRNPNESPSAHTSA